MGKRGVIGKYKRIRLPGDLAVILLLGGLFLLGGVSGCLAAGYVEGESGAALEEYLHTWLKLTGERGGTFSAARVIWERFRVPLCIVLLSFTAFGVLCIPAVLMLRGFLFSFSAACFVRLFGWKGLLLASVLFGLSALLWVPALFLLGVLGLESSYRILRRWSGRKEASLLPTCPTAGWGICLLLLGLSAALECFVVPGLTAMLAGKLL